MKIAYLDLTRKFLFLLLFIYQIPTIAQTIAFNDSIYINNSDNITINVLANDVIEGDEPVSIEIVNYPTNGNIEINQDNSIVYSPSSNFIDDKLNDSFTYNINGNSNEAEVFLLVNDCTTCIWPGDTYQDGIVNVWDLLPIGLAYGSTGEPRENEGTDWNGFPAAEDWGIELYDSDYKYIDCNGDGTIDENDMEAIEQNYEATHDFATPPTLPTANNEPFSITLDIQNDGNVSLGDTVVIHVNLGTPAGQDIPNLYGAAFSFSPPQGFIQSAEIDFSDSVLGNNENTISLSKTTADNTRFDAAIVRTNQTAVDIVGIDNFLGKINVVMVEVLEGKTEDFEEMVSINLDGFMAVNAAGETAVIDTVFGDNFVLVGTENVVENSIPKLKVFPNPTQDILTISLPPAHDFQYLEMIDISGKMVLQQNDLQFFTDKINIDTKGLNNGFYLLKMQNAETQITQKISVLRH